MTTRTKLSKADKAIKPILAACYPDWKGRKLAVAAAETYQMADYWDGGSRSYVKAYDLASGKVVDPASMTHNPMNGSAHARVTIPDGVLLVEHSIFCGKDGGVTIYANLANMPRLLMEAK